MSAKIFHEESVVYFCLNNPVFFCGSYLVFHSSERCEHVLIEFYKKKVTENKCEIHPRSPTFTFFVSAYFW